MKQAGLHGWPGVKRWMAAAGLWLLLAGTLRAQGLQYGMEFQVNTYTESYQIFPSIASSHDGTFIIAWTSGGQERKQKDIFAKSFNIQGNESEEFQVNTITGYDQDFASVTALPNGDFAIAWQTFDSAPQGNWDISAQRFDDEGNKLGSEFRVNTTYAARAQKNPALTTLSGGGFVIVWESCGYASDAQDGSDCGIFAQRFDCQGSKLEGEFQVNTYTVNDQYDPAIAALPDGGFVVCWTSNGQDGSYTGIFARYFDAKASEPGVEFQVNTCTQDSESYSCIAALTGGSFVITWLSYYSGSLCAQRFDGKGNKLGGEFRITNSNVNLFHSIAALPDGGFVVVWESWHRNGAEWIWDISAQRFDAQGNKIGFEFPVSTFSSNTYYNKSGPCISVLPDGDFVIAWSSYGQDGSDWGVFAKLFPAEPQVHPLQRFSLLNPVIDATERTCQPTFAWQKPSAVPLIYPWEIEYHLFIDTLPDFSTARILTGVYDTAYQIDALAAAHTYYWKVAALNTAGDSLWANGSDWAFFIPAGLAEIGENSAPGQLSGGIRLLTNTPTTRSTKIPLCVSRPMAESARKTPTWRSTPLPAAAYMPGAFPCCRANGSTKPSGTAATIPARPCPPASTCCA